MKRGYVLPILVLAAASTAQGVSVFFNAIEIGFETRLEPAGNTNFRFPDGVSVDGACQGAPKICRVHRFITDGSDPAHRRRFGYDFVIEALPDPQTVRLRMEPLTGAGANPGETMLAPPKFPSIPVVHMGETVALDLLVNPATGQKVVDYLSLRPRAAPVAKPASGAPRDFGLGDIEMSLGKVRVWVNGKPLDLTLDEATGGVSAHILWLGFRGAGSFEISLGPEPGFLGFQKAGTVNGKTLTFHFGPTEYRVESETPIAPSPGLYNVYVRHDPGYEGGFMVAGSDKPGMIHVY